MPEDEEGMYWEDRRRYEEEYMEMARRGNMGPYLRGRPFPGGAPPVSYEIYTSFKLCTVCILLVFPRWDASKNRI